MILQMFQLKSRTNGHTLRRYKRKPAPVSSFVKIENLHKSYDALHVVKGVSLDVEEGQVVSIIGASGSGKSTFLRCLNLLEMPQAGEIIIDGERLPLGPDGPARKVTDQKALTQLRADTGMVFQNFNLWTHLTVLQNVIEGPMLVKNLSKADATAKALALLERVGLSDKTQQYPAELSGGQQQRVAIARTLAMDPKVLLFDEPTSALDPEMVGEVLQVIRDLAAEGRTMIVVTHEMGFAREVSQKVVFLHNGKVEEQGPPAQLFDAPQSEITQRFLSKVL